VSPTSTRWVLIDDTAGAKCADGSRLSAAALAHIAEAVQAQLNGEFADEWGMADVVRVGSGPKDIQVGERVYSFLATLPNAPGASAYHDVNGNGVPVSYCAVTTCGSLYGPDGVSVDVSHELCEASVDPGCNITADDMQGSVHALEACDAVEVQTYGKKCADGTVVQVSNFLLRSWTIPGAAGPYDYMCKAGLPGAVAPPGPMQTAPSSSGQGNYQIVGPSNANQETQVFGRLFGWLRGKKRGMQLRGAPRKAAKVAHWSSRTSRRLGRR